MDIAVIIPCLDEASTVGQVVRDFAGYFPKARIFVYDNMSADDTALKAKLTGLCQVRECRIRGKGAVIRQALGEIDADYYILADGDSTYSAKDARTLLTLMRMKRLDMIVGDRAAAYEGQPLFHGFGNRLVDLMLRIKFRSKYIKDAMSGLRIFDRKIAEGFVPEHDGFEIETELTIWCAKNNMRIRSYPISYGSRPEGSVSKLGTFRDGWRIIKLILETKRR